MLTVSRIRWSEYEIISQYVEIIPHIELVISGIVFHCRYVLVLIRKVNIHKLPVVEFRVINIVDDTLAYFALVVLVRGPDHVEHSTYHERVGCRALVICRFPRGVESQSIGVQLANNNHAIVLFCGVDDPKPVLVHGQVYVCLATPLVWGRVVIVCIVNDGLPTLDSRPEVKLYDVACSLFVEKHSPVVHHKSSTINSVRELVCDSLPRVLKVVERRVLNECVCAIGSPGHEIDLVTSLKRVFAPGTSLLLRLKEKGRISDCFQSPRTNKN